MQERHQTNAYPFRMEPGIREEAQKLADQEDRSLNWLLNALVKLALPIWAAKRKQGGDHE